jgi:demethylmenaquinone methyltransferase/2-methoxy-6-polyprenyl-1,4-benzoquinol methylase
MNAVQALIAEQITYCRHRAVEYDQTSRPPDDSLESYGTELVSALDRFRPTGDVLEIASGTGAWTTELLRHASRPAYAACRVAPHAHAARLRAGGGVRDL